MLGLSTFNRHFIICSSFIIFNSNEFSPPYKMSHFICKMHKLTHLLHLHISINPHLEKKTILKGTSNTMSTPPSNFHSKGVVVENLMGYYMEQSDDYSDRGQITNCYSTHNIIMKKIVRQ